MAEAATNVPTFKLVLVGDGGTGKVSVIDMLDAPLVVVLGVDCARTALPTFQYRRRIYTRTITNG